MSEKQQVPIEWADVQAVAQDVPQFATMLENAALKRMLATQASKPPKNAGPPAPVASKQRKKK